MPSTTSCPGCGAAINVDYTPGKITYTTCPYCKYRVAVTAPGINDIARPVVEPVPDAPTPDRRPARLALLAGVVALVIGAAAAMLLVRSKVPENRQAAGETLTPATAEPSSTIVCYGDQRMTLNNETITKDKTAVMASGNCRLVIKSSSLASPSNALVATGDSVVIIEQCTLSGGNNAIIASGNARVRITGSIVKSGNTALISSGEAVVDLDGSVLDGGDSAYIRSGDSRIIMKDTRVSGRTQGTAETR